MRAIIPCAAVVCALLIGGARQGRTPPARLPTGWIAVTSPDPQADGFICAYWADTTWHVALTRDSTALRISRDSAQRDTAMIDAPGGGLLLGYNGGEFGGEVLYVGKDRTRTPIAKQNLSFFVRTRSGILGLGGLDHLGMHKGWLLTFKRGGGGAWVGETLMSLEAEPRAYTALSDDSLLVVTMGTLTVLRPPSYQAVVYRSPLSAFIDPRSVVRDRAGVIYVGTRYAVTRLMPHGSGYTDDWIVPASCPRRVRTAKTGKCACATDTRGG